MKKLKRRMYMKKYSMWKGLFALSLLFVFLAALSVQAAETRTPIDHLNLYVDGDRNDGWNEDITLRLSTPDSEYRVGDWYLSNSNTATVPIFKVELYAANGYYFDLSSSDVELSGKEARCTGRSIRDDKETLIITLKVEGLAVDLDNAGDAFAQSKLVYRAGATFNLSFLSIGLNVLLPGKASFSQGGWDVMNPMWESTRVSAVALFNFG